MKYYKYPNTIQWKIGFGVMILTMISIIFLEIRDLKTLWVIISINLPLVLYAVYHQYSKYNRLMEIGIDDKQIIAKRWGGISNVVTMDLSSLIQIEEFTIDEKRQGLKLTDGINTILIGKSIQDYEEIDRLFRKLGKL